jgi:kynurenine formamidase
VKLVDLTYTLDEHSPYWPEAAPGTPFRAETAATYQHDGFFARTLRLPEHFGTHLDAPRHFDVQGKSVDELPVRELVLEAVVVDVRSSAGSDPDYGVTVEDLRNWEAAHGPIPQGGAVLAFTGWGAHWPSQPRYMNPDGKGVLHFPGFSLAAAQYLLDRTRPGALGIDTASIDCGASQNCEVHRLTMHAGLYHLENLAHLEQMPPAGAVLIALPLKWRSGSGSPARVVALTGRD